MTPKEELIYRMIVKNGPLSQPQIMNMTSGKTNRNDYSLIGSLERDGFIKKICCKHCNRDGLYKATKRKIKPNRVMSQLS